MHGIEEFASGKPAGPPSNGPWWRELTSYHWFVFVVAALGWLFDTMDQQLFNLARVPALRELLVNADPALKAEKAELLAAIDAAGPGDSEEAQTARAALGAFDTRLRPKVNEYGGYATSIFLIGWATGGLAFGVLGDRIGRARTMLWTILLYSLFTGLSAASTGFWDFAFYRFLTGLGVGGEFAVGVALVAEVMPDRARPHALGLLQASSAIGNVTAALLGMGLGHLEETGAVGSAWRVMFVIGTAPALLAVLIRRNLKEPERWQAATTAGETAGPAKRAGSYVELFGNPRWRHNALVGLALSFSGIVGLWGIGFFSIDLIQGVLRKYFAAEGLSPAQIDGKVAFWAAMTSVTLNIGAFFGMYAFSQVTHYLGRRPAFAITFVLAMLSTAMVFWGLDTFAEIFWMVPIMGFCQLALFGGYAIYFPELFPTHLRSTGTSFCYNVGRYVAAVGPALLGLLTSRVFAGYDEPMRYAGVTMCAVFLIGLAALPFAPETKGKPLPE